MPELPDVERHRRTVAEHAAGRRVREVRVPLPRMLSGTTPQGLGRSLAGRAMAEPHRHGKWLILRTDDGAGPLLVLHFGMTGLLAWTAAGSGSGDATEADRSDPSDVLTLRFDNGVLAYRSRRHLGRIVHLPPGSDPAEATGPLGPDATAVDEDGLRAVLAGRRGSLKSALMDQERIAGLGNELVDEILWRAGLDPRGTAARLAEDGEASRRLYRGMREVLRHTIRAGHVPSGPNWLNALRRDEAPTCPHCGADLERTTVGGRTTLLCPREQARSA